MIDLKRKSVQGAIFISLASIMWGFDGIVLTPRLSNLPVPFVVFVLHIIPFLLMTPFLAGKVDFKKDLDKKTFISLFLVALLGGALGTIAIVKALFLVNFQQLSVVVLLQKLQPLFGIILAAVYLKEKISKHIYLWGSIAILAGYFLTFGLNLPDFSNNSNLAMAAFYSIFASFSFGASTVFSKPLLAKVDYFKATYFRYGMTVLILLPLVIIGGHMGSFGNITNANWIIFLITALTTGSGAILLYYYGLRHVKASVSTISELFFPISAVLFDYFINGNILSPIQWVAAAIMIFSILKINTSKS